MRFLLALSLLLATPCWAQSEENIFVAGKLLARGRQFLSRPA